MAVGEAEETHGLDRGIARIGESRGQRTMLERGQRPMSKKGNSETSNPLAAMQAEMLDVLKEPLTAASIIKLQKMAKIAYEITMIDKPTIRKSGPSYMSMGALTSDMIDLPMPDGDSTVLAPAPAAETFGSTTIRELITGLAQLNKPALPAIAAPAVYEPSVVELVTAMEKAKAAHMDDAFEMLQQKFYALYGMPSSSSESPMYDVHVRPPEEGSKPLLPLIKAVRARWGMSLKQAKDVIDNGLCVYPKVTIEDANRWQTEMAKEGISTTIKKHVPPYASNAIGASA